MKKQGIALIVVVVFISAIISLVVSNLIFASPKNRQQKVEKVDPISSNFTTPDSTYFNPQSVDPTKLITIGPNTNPNPFNGAAQ